MIRFMYTKDPADETDYALEYSRDLAPTETIVAVVATSINASASVIGTRFTRTTAIVRVGGGGIAAEAQWLVRTTTSTGQVWNDRCAVLVAAR